MKHQLRLNITCIPGIVHTIGIILGGYYGRRWGPHHGGNRPWGGAGRGANRGGFGSSRGGFGGGRSGGCRSGGGGGRR
jgi:hypothetical protein